MSTDWRSLAAELAAELERCRPLAEVPDCLARARAALAANADGPAVQSREPASVACEPSDGDLLQLMPEQFRADLGTVSRMAAHGAGPDIKPGLFRVSLNTGALEYARAVLARWGRSVPTPVEGEVAELALKELERTVVLLMPVTGHKKIKRFDTIRAALKRLQVLENKADLSPAPPAPKPAEGEVAELVAALRTDAECVEVEDYALCNMTADQMRRAADLLSQRHPTPVPVAERPWERDGWCDEQGQCWWFNPGQPAMSNPHIATSSWRLCRMLNGKPMGNHCLPAAALHLPAGEVQP